jgi:hypothetical protein
MPKKGERAPAERLREEVIVRGIIETIWAHRYQLSAEETAELRTLLQPYWEQDILDDVHVAVRLFAGPAADSDLDEAAERLREHLLANLTTSEESLELEEAARNAYGELRRVLSDIAESGEQLVEPEPKAPNKSGEST